MPTSKTIAGRTARERATILARLAFLDAADLESKPHVCNGHDHTACANKERKTGYWHAGIEFENGMPIQAVTWIPDRSTVDCRYDRKHLDPACAKANCSRIRGGK